MDFQNLIGQLINSRNPISMAMNSLPNNNMRSLFSSVMNGRTDQEKAQRIADICNKNGITKEQLQSALKRNRF